MARLLLRHGANPDARRRGHKSAFMMAVHLAKMHSIEEMAKWKTEEQEITRSHVFSDARKFPEVRYAIARGRRERTRMLGEREMVGRGGRERRRDVLGDAFSREGSAGGRPAGRFPPQRFA